MIVDTNRQTTTRTFRRSINSRGNCEQLIWFIVIFVRTSFSINNKRFFVILFRGSTIYRRDHHDAPKIWFHLFSNQLSGVRVNKTWFRLASELHFIVSRLELQIDVAEGPDRLKVASGCKCPIAWVKAATQGLGKNARRVGESLPDIVTGWWRINKIIICKFIIHTDEGKEREERVGLLCENFFFRRTKTTA